MSNTEILKLKRRLTRLRKNREKDIGSFVRTIETTFSQSLNEIANRLGRGDFTAVQAAGVLNDLEQVMSRNGFTKEYARIKNIYADELEAIKELTDEVVANSGFEANTLIDSGVSEQQIQAIVNIEVDRTTKTLQRAVADAKSTLFRSVITGTPIDFVEITKDLPAKYANQIRTEINTSTSIFNQTVTVNSAIEVGFDLFLYTGPDDKLTRDFCEQVLDGTILNDNRPVPIYTVGQIASMSNGQLPNVLVSAGGWNCRHEWIPVDLDFAKGAGLKERWLI